MTREQSLTLKVQIHVEAAERHESNAAWWEEIRQGYSDLRNRDRARQYAISAAGLALGERNQAAQFRRAIAELSA